MSSAKKVIGDLGAMSTLVENFPMSILDDMGSQGESYDSVFKFLVDLLNSCGIDTNKILSELINYLYQVEYRVEFDAQNVLEEVSSLKNARLEGVEKTVRILLNSFFAGLFSCAITPFIPNKFFDSSDLKCIVNNEDALMGNNLKYAIDSRYYVYRTNDLVIPIQLLDLFNILKVSPTSQKGLKYYDVNSKYVYYKKKSTVEQGTGNIIYDYEETENLTEKEKLSGKIVTTIPESKIINELSPNIIYKYEGVSPNMLYLSKDMNAFIWYVMNLSYSHNAESYNKMMWDNRNMLKNLEKASESELSTAYNRWYNSKTISNELEIDSRIESKYPDGELSSDDEIFYNLTPIIQLEPLKGIDEVDKSNAIVFHFPSQVYFAPEKRERIKNGLKPKRSYGYFNATMWKFNEDYLNSIQIFNPRFLLIRTIENLYGEVLGLANSFDVSINEILIKRKIQQIIRNFVQTEDGKIEDCYFEFSNEDFDDAVTQFELEKRGLYINKYGEASEAGQTVIDSLTSPMVNGSQAGTSDTIERTINQITGNIYDSSTDDYRQLNINFDDNLTFENLIMSFIMPFVESMFTPQIMLYIIVNMKVLGLVNETSLSVVENVTDDPMVRFIITRVLTIIKSLIKFISDLILQVLLNLVLKYLMPTIYKWVGILTIERINDWLALLYSAYKCLPTFKFETKKIQDGPDDVVYADILPEDEEQTEPEKDNKC